MTKAGSVAALAVFLAASTAVMALSKPWAANRRKGPNVRPPCCNKYASKPVPLRLLKFYEHSDKSCSLQAVIFTTVHDRWICADPNAEWTQHGIHHLNRNF